MASWAHGQAEQRLSELLRQKVRFHVTLLRVISASIISEKKF